MERAGKTLAKLKMSKSFSAEELACAAWPVAVGVTIARHSTAITLVRGKLVIEVEDATWQKPLFQLEAQILKSMSAVVGQGLVRDIEIRIAGQRRPPQRATQLTATASAPIRTPVNRQVDTPASTDDADRIGDSVMRLVYKQARKRASA